MKNQLFSFIVLLTICSFSNSHYSFGQSKCTVTDTEIINAAKANLQNYINGISDHYDDFGFNDTTEFDKAVIGIPYQYAEITDTFFSDKEFINDRCYVNLVNEWFVSILVDSEIRCFINFVCKGDTLNYIGGGASYLARNFNYTEKYFNIPDGLKRILLSSDELLGCACFYLTTFDSTNNNYEFYPELNASSKTKCTPQKWYQRYKSLNELFVSYKTGVFPDAINTLSLFDNNNSTFPIKPNTTVSIKIFNLQGQLIVTDQFTNDNFSVYLLNKDKRLNPGLYFYEIQSNPSIFKGKFLVQ
jgi:hypothetical protein